MSASLVHPMEALHTRRAKRVTSPRSRRKLAAALNRTVREAEKPPAPFTAAVPLQRREVLKARADIEQLAQDLVAPGDVEPRGVLLVRKLLTDGSSPLFMPSEDGALARAVHDAHTALLLR